MTSRFPRIPHITPGLVVDNGLEAIEFYARAFGAEPVLRLEEMGGKIMFAELRIGDSLVTVGDAMPEYGVEGARPRAPVPSSLLIYCEDADALHAQAVAAGATEITPVADQFHGDRAGIGARSVRPPVVDRDPHRGHDRGRDAAADGNGDEPGRKPPFGGT